MKVVNQNFSLNTYTKGAFPYSSSIVVECTKNGQKMNKEFATEINYSGELPVDKYIQSLVKDFTFEVRKVKTTANPKGSFYLFLPGQEGFDSSESTGILVNTADAPWYWLNRTAVAAISEDGILWYHPSLKYLNLTPGFLE